MAAPDRSGTAHLLIGLGLLAAGVLTIFSIGFALLTLGLVHLALYPVRHRPTVYRPVMHGAVAFWIGFIAVAPMVCTHTDVMGTGEAWCRSLAGIRYPVEGASAAPGLFAGIAAAMLAATTSLSVQRRRAAGSA